MSDQIDLNSQTNSTSTEQTDESVLPEPTINNIEIRIKESEQKSRTD